MQSKQTRAAVLYGPGDLRLESREVREPEADEVVLQVAVSGICGDRPALLGRLAVRFVVPGAIRSLDSRARVHRHRSSGGPRSA